MTNAVYWELTDVPVPLLTPNSHSFPQYLPSPVHCSFLRTLLQTHRNVFSGFLHADQPKSQQTFLNMKYKWKLKDSCLSLSRHTQKHSLHTKTLSPTRNSAGDKELTTSVAAYYFLAADYPEDCCSPKGCPEPAQPTARPNLVHSCLHWNPLNKKSRKDQHQKAEIHLQTKELKWGAANKLDPREESLSRARPSLIRSDLGDIKPIKGLEPSRAWSDTFSFSGRAEARGQGGLSQLWSQIQMDLFTVYIKGLMWPERKPAKQ